MVYLVTHSCVAHAVFTVACAITMHSMWDTHILHARTNFSHVQSNFACLEGGVFIWEGGLQVVGTQKYAKHVVKTVAVAENLSELPSLRNKCKRLISKLATEY